MSHEYKKVITNKKAEASRLMSRDQILKCNIAIHTAAVASGTAGAVPIPVVDAVPISMVQVSMVLALGKIFDQKISESVAKGIVSATASSIVGRNLIKLIPIVGWIVSATVAAGITEAIGWTIAVDLAKDAKKEWIEKNSIAQSDSSVEEPDKEKNEREIIINGLEARGNEFLKGNKTPTKNKNEYNELLHDFENVLDDLEDSLKVMYKKLSSM